MSKDYQAQMQTMNDATSAAAAASSLFSSSSSSSLLSSQSSSLPFPNLNSTAASSILGTSWTHAPSITESTILSSQLSEEEDSHSDASDGQSQSQQQQQSHQQSQNTQQQQLRHVTQTMRQTHIAEQQMEQIPIDPTPVVGCNPYHDRQPNPSLAPEDVISIQLGAMKYNDLPHADAGVEICFRFASPANRLFTGPVGRFIRMMHNPLYGVMLNYDSIQFIPANVQGTKWRLLITKQGEGSTFMWSLSLQTAAPYAGCWMTDNVLLVRD